MDFILIHGAQHGAWCWEHLVPLLDERGHRTVAVDLPVEDLDAGLIEYTDAVERAAQGLAAPIVVGHSLSGLILPLVAGRLDARAMVYVCAMIPVEGQSLADQVREDPTMITYPRDSMLRDGNGRTLAPPEVAADCYYEDCDPAIARWASSRLRWQAHRISAEAFPFDAWPATPSSYVLCREDRCVSSSWSRAAASDRLGVEPFELDGGHSPFLSRPRALASVLDDIAGAQVETR